MKNILYLIVSFLMLFNLGGCDRYLEVELQNQMTIEEVFNKRQTTEAYLAQIYGFLPNENDMWGRRYGALE